MGAGRSLRSVTPQFLATIVKYFAKADTKVCCLIFLLLANYFGRDCRKLNTLNTN